ncbi:MAG TPA: carboxypeptidase-like regulatory domain-containing protein [Bacteroidia bacterium]|nr:carboxypeptidase-like regulatory domain-containing protein [Bacteroidia bacterium]
MKQLLLYLFLFANTKIFCQQITQTVRGTITDADSKQPLEGVAVIFIGNNTVSTTSDAKGNFKLQGIPVGRQGFQFSFLGYNARTLNNIEITSGKETVLNIELSEKVFETKTVEITASKQNNRPNNEMATLSVRNFNSEETNRYAGSRGDPSRLAASTAGVSSGNDARNDIIVRGNSPIGVLWRLENIDIPNPNHFSAQGATGGPISILNNNLLANSDFYTGAWPADYGNKSAAVFDLKLRNGNNEKREFTGQVGINGFELGAEGPFKKEYNGSYLVNYRYSTLDAFTALGINFGVSGQPRYQDVSWKINLPTSKLGTFNFWGIGGISNISLLDSEKKSGDWAFTNSGTDLVYGSQMGASGVSNTHYYNQKTFGKLSLSATTASFIATADTIALNKEKFRTFSSNSTDNQFHLQYLVNSKINSRNLIRFTSTYSSLNLKYKIGQFDRTYGLFIDLLNEDSNTGLLQASLSWQFKLNDKIIINSGIHYQHLFLNNTYAIEPRAGFKWLVSKTQSLNAAYGLHNQMQPLINYFYKSYNFNTNTYTQTNKNMDFTQSNHFVLGYENVFNEHYRLKIESYYQTQSKVPVNGAQSDYFSMLNQGSDIGGLDLVDSLVNTGLGKNYGVEITLEKIFHKHYYVLFTTSLFESFYRGSNMVWHHTAFSGGFVGNILAGYELPLKSGKYKLSFDVKSTLAGGNRYVPIDEAASQQIGRAVYIEERAFDERFKNFRKTDVKVAFKINQKKISQSLFVSLENIFNAKNVLRQYYDPRLGKLKIEYQFGLFPIGGYRIEF